jgi:hypothetical protein
VHLVGFIIRILLSMSQCTAAVLSRIELSNHTTAESEIWLGDYSVLVSEVGFLAACV